MVDPTSVNYCLIPIPRCPRVRNVHITVLLANESFANKNATLVQPSAAQLPARSGTLEIRAVSVPSISQPCHSKPYYFSMVPQTANDRLTILCYFCM